MADGVAMSGDRLGDFDGLWDYSRPEVTEGRFREVLSAAGGRGDRGRVMELKTQIARCLGLRGKFAECHGVLDEVEAGLGEDVPVAWVRYLLERGRAFNSSGEGRRAMEFFVEAWERGNAAGAFGYAVDAAHMAAIAEADLEGQVMWNLRAIELAEKHERKWLPSIYNNLGETHRVRKEYGEALACFEKRAGCLRELGREVDMYTVKDLARMNRMMGRAEVGLGIIEPVAVGLKGKGEFDGYIGAEYGQCLAAVGRVGEARGILAEAYGVLSKDAYMIEYEGEELGRIRELAGIQG